MREADFNHVLVMVKNMLVTKDVYNLIKSNLKNSYN